MGFKIKRAYAEWMGNTMDAEMAARLLFEKYQYNDWLISIGIAQSTNASEYLLVYSTSLKKAQRSIPDQWMGYRVCIHSAHPPRVMLS
jgi:hypothetical protein